MHLYSWLGSSARSNVLVVSTNSAPSASSSDLYSSSSRRTGSCTAVTPNAGMGEYLITGMKESFRIGLVREPNCQSSQGNTPSAMERANVISNFLSSQCRVSHVLGPLLPEDSAGVITSCMAVFPKALQANSGSLWTCRLRTIAA